MRLGVKGYSDGGADCFCTHAGLSFHGMEVNVGFHGMSILLHGGGVRFNLHGPFFCGTGLGSIPSEGQNHVPL
jgi:hypothetical protein